MAAATPARAARRIEAGKAEHRLTLDLLADAAERLPSEAPLRRADMRIAVNATLDAWACKLPPEAFLDRERAHLEAMTGTRRPWTCRLGAALARRSRRAPDR